MIALVTLHGLLPTGKPRFSASLLLWRPRWLRTQGLP